MFGLKNNETITRIRAKRNRPVKKNRLKSGSISNNQTSTKHEPKTRGAIQIQLSRNRNHPRVSGNVKQNKQKKRVLIRITKCNRKFGFAYETLPHCKTDRKIKTYQQNPR